MQSAFRLTIATCLLVALSITPAWAKTATEVFAAAASSIVVVQTKDAKGKTQGTGSGVVIGEEEVVTNCHVIEDAAGYAVSYGKRQFAARLKNADWTRDVCSLTVKGLNASAVPLGSTKRLKVGQKVFAIGAPQGLELTLSEGILSSLRELDGGRYLQISAPISPGSSGGGLFDDAGKLIGLPTFYLSEGQQLNFAVPVEWVQALPQRATKSKPKGPPRSEWMAKATALEQKRDWPGLLSHAWEWTRAQPGEAAALFILGVAYDKSGQVEKAIEAYQQALRIHPENAGAWDFLGNAYGQSGQQAQAIEAYQQAARIDPEFSRAWIGLGIAYFRSKLTEKAVEAYQQALRIDPELAVAWKFLAFAYDQSGQTAKAFEAFLQALRIDPNDASTWDSLGFAYIDSGQLTHAIVAFEQAVRIDPEFSRAWAGLGMAYHHSGQRKKAIEVYQRLKNIDPKRADEYFEAVILP